MRLVPTERATRYAVVRVAVDGRSSALWVVREEISNDQTRAAGGQQSERKTRLGTYILCSSLRILNEKQQLVTG